MSFFRHRLGGNNQENYIGNINHFCKIATITLLTIISVRIVKSVNIAISKIYLYNHFVN
jgi:hypothetical protein